MCCICLVSVPTIFPTIVDVSTVNVSTVIVTWDMIPDDREHIKGVVLGYTVCIQCTCNLVEIS